MPLRRNGWIKHFQLWELIKNPVARRNSKSANRVEICSRAVELNVKDEEQIAAAAQSVQQERTIS
jgi:hypothetical protein